MKRVVVHSLVVLLLVLVTVLIGAYVRGRNRLDARRPLAPIAMRETDDPAALARGEHLAHTFGGCAKCHGDDLGGQVMLEDVLMRVVAPNLTRGRGGLGSEHDFETIARSITHGVAVDGRPLVIMPSDELRKLGDDDVAALVSYILRAPPVDRDLAPTSVSALGTLLVGGLDLPILAAETIPTARPPRPRVTSGVTREHGLYLVDMCRGCHGPALRGGLTQAPGSPPSADISPEGLRRRRYAYADFARAMRTGVRPDGTRLDPAMPWSAMAGMTDEELQAMWLALAGTP